MSPTEFGIAFLSTWNRQCMIYKYFDALRLFHKNPNLLFLYARLFLYGLEKCLREVDKLAEKLQSVKFSSRQAQEICGSGTNSSESMDG